MFTDIMLNVNYDVNTLVTNIMNMMMPGKVIYPNILGLKVAQGIDQLK